MLEKISYEIIVSCHCHLLTLNLKPISRTLEESSVYQMLDFLAKEDRIPYGVSLCMLLISKGDLVTMDVFSSVERRKLECIRHMDQMLSSEAFLAAGKALLQEHMEASYVPASCRTFERTVIHFYVFLDMNGLGYLPEIADIWLNCNVVKHAFQVFFASPFWKKLQSKNGQPCMSKKDKVARIPGTHGAGMNPLQTGYLYQR